MAKVIYSGNGSTGGSPPTDGHTYNAGDTVTVLGNTGNLVKGGDTFAYWNTAPDGTGNFFGPTATFAIGAADVTLYAMWYTTTGLTAGGATTHFKFVYDAVLATAAFGNVEPARTNSLLANAANGVPVIENDYAWMQAQFAGVDITKAEPLPIPVSVSAITEGGYSASWWPVVLVPGTRPASLLRCLIVAEVVEVFMSAQHKGWGYSSGVGDEESCGEALSLFLAIQFQLANGLGTSWLSNGTPSTWLNTSLPASNPASTEFDPNGNWGPKNTHYGSRADYVNSTLPYAGNGPGTGCSLAFIYYLFHQLGHSSIPQIIAAAPGVDSSGNLIGPSCLRGVYQDLTGDTADPFPLFRQLLDNAYPTNAVSAIPGPNPDDPFPLALISFWVDKNTFGKDEVKDVLATHAGRFDNAFWLVIEGFTIDQFNALGVTVPAFTGAFASLPGVTISRSATPIAFENPGQPGRLQRIRIAFDITFTAASLTSFPGAKAGPKVLELDGQLSVGGAVPRGATCSTIFELTAGADPYFTNVDPAQNNVFWLSQDLRVFKATPAKNQTPVTSGPAFGTDSVAGAFAYIAQLLGYLNANFADPSGIDPFATLLPGQSGALSGDSSVSPLTVEIDNSTTFPFLPTIHLYNNYNFAVARVRLRGLAGDVASKVKVFFRLWSTQTADTDFQPTTTYLSTQTGGHPSAPLVGVDNHTIPFFATGNFGANTDYGPGGVNDQDIKLDLGDSKWAYFGCFLNVYDQTNLVNGQPIQTLLNGSHHCLVAELACDSAPILNSANVTESPENSDKLAQRNLQFTASDNPGSAASHRIPQTFDVRPSLPLLSVPGSLLEYPDELMIDWGRTPVGATASIYWPQVDAAAVLALARTLHGGSELSASDPHTISCKVTGGVSYVPIPPGTGPSYAGLITLELPTTVVAGQEFDVIVRRVTTRRISATATGAPAQPPAQRARGRVRAHDVNAQARSAPVAPGASGSSTRPPIRNWRYVTGTFQIRIPVGTPATLLAPELNALAIFKWRLQQMSPASRWYPVLQRYVAYLGGRVVGLGGDPGAVPPSPLGYWGAPPGQGPAGEKSCTGKITEVVFDCTGRMEAFVVRECCEREHRFVACDRDLQALIVQACTNRYQVTVRTSAAHPEEVKSLIIRG